MFYGERDDASRDVILRANKAVLDDEHAEFSHSFPELLRRPGVLTVAGLQILSEQAQDYLFRYQNEQPIFLDEFGAEIASLSTIESGARMIPTMLWHDKQDIGYQLENLSNWQKGYFRFDQIGAPSIDWRKGLMFREDLVNKQVDWYFGSEELNPGGVVAIYEVLGLELGKMSCALKDIHGELTDVKVLAVCSAVSHVLAAEIRSAVVGERLHNDYYKAMLVEQLRGVGILMY